MNLKKVLLGICIAIATLGITSCSESFDPVNPVIFLKSGFENGNGTKSKPYGDILDAIEKAKELGMAGAEHITLNFGAGDYSLTETPTLSNEAFGGASLEMICEDDEKAIVGAWLPVTGFTETEVNGVKAWVADMPRLNGETVYSHQFFNGRYERLERPRYPEEGFLRNEFITNKNRDKLNCTDCDYYVYGGDIYGGDIAGDAFYFFEGDIPENLTRTEDIQMCMFHYWNDEKLSIKNIDYEKNLMEFTSAAWFTFIESHDGIGGRYFLDNVFECLNTPGEVYNDRTTGKLYYVPYADEKIEDFKIFASTIDTLLIIDGMNGTSEKNSLTMKNIGFMERNILVNDYSSIYNNIGNKQSWADDSNLMWDYTLGEQLISHSDSFATLESDGKFNQQKQNNATIQRGQGFYKNAVIADPLFADPFNGDFTLAENSPAWDIDFEPIDISDVGPRN